MPKHFRIGYTPLMEAKKPKPKPAKKGKTGRRARFTEDQKEGFRKRLLAGERASHIAKEQGVDEKVIRLLKNAPSKTGTETRLPVAEIKKAAQKSVENDLNDPEIRESLDKMGVTDRGLFHSHKSDLLEIIMHQQMAARYSAQNAHRLAMMAQNHFGKIDAEGEFDDVARGSLKDGMAFQIASNEASKQPLKMMEITLRAPVEPQDPSQPRRIIHENAPPE